MGNLRIAFRLCWFGLIFVIVVGAITALAANISVPASKASVQSFAVDANAIKPAECAGIVLGGFSWQVSGRDSGLYFGTAGNDTINSGTGSDCVLAAGGDDTLDGRGGNDVLLGENGNDFLGGDNGDDTLYGDAGNDTLQGNSGNDLIFGGDGNDNIDGGTGTDTCYGGSGTNTFTRCEVCYNGAANTPITCP